VTLYVPEYVLGHWWEQLLHNQSALRLKARLLMQPGVVVASVPYQLKSAMHVRAASMPAPQPGGRAGGPDESAPPSLQRESPKPGGPGEPAKPAAADRLAPWHRLTAGLETLHAEELQVDIAEVSATPIGDCLDHEFVDVSGTLRTVTLRPRGASLTMEADLWDGTGNITLIWLGRRDIPGIRPGRRVTVHGRIARIKDARTIYNPTYQLRPGPD
jgi:hypothetical protein